MRVSRSVIVPLLTVSPVEACGAKTFTWQKGVALSASFDVGCCFPLKNWWRLDFKWKQVGACRSLTGIFWPARPFSTFDTDGPTTEMTSRGVHCVESVSWWNQTSEEHNTTQKCTDWLSQSGYSSDSRIRMRTSANSNQTWSRHGWLRYLQDEDRSKQVNPPTHPRPNEAVQALDGGRTT